MLLAVIIMKICLNKTSWIKWLPLHKLDIIPYIQFQVYSPENRTCMILRDPIFYNINCLFHFRRANEPLEIQPAVSPVSEVVKIFLS